MAIDVIGFAVAKVEADKRGLAAQDANRIGVIGAVMPNPITALVVARSMAERQAPVTESQPEVPATIDLVPPEREDPETPPTPTTPTPTPTLASLSNRVDAAKTAADEAKTAAGEAKTAATEAKAAVQKLDETVTKGFERIEKYLGGSSQPSGSTGSSTPTQAAAEPKKKSV